LKFGKARYLTGPEMVSVSGGNYQKTPAIERQYSVLPLSSPSKVVEKDWVGSCCDPTPVSILRAETPCPLAKLRVPGYVEKT